MPKYRQSDMYGGGMLCPRAAADRGHSADVLVAGLQPFVAGPAHLAVRRGVRGGPGLARPIWFVRRFTQDDGQMLPPPAEVFQRHVVTIDHCLAIFHEMSLRPISA